MPCLNCTSRVLRIFFHDALFLPLRPLHQPLQPRFRRPVTLSSTYSRLSSHLTSTAWQQQLSSLVPPELTDDDYIPFVYPAHLAVPVGEGGVLGEESRSGWPPPIPEVVGGVGGGEELEARVGEIGVEDYGYELDIELTEPYKTGEWWDSEVEVEEMMASEDGGEDEWDLTPGISEREIEVPPTGGCILTRAGSWTLDSSPIVHMFHIGSNGKRPSVAARKEGERLKKKAAQAAAERNTGGLGGVHSNGGMLSQAELRLERPMKEVPSKKPKVNKAKRGKNSPPFEESQRLAGQVQDISRDGEKKPRAKRLVQDKKGEERRPYVEEYAQPKEGMESSRKKGPPKKYGEGLAQPGKDAESLEQKPYERKRYVPLDLEKEPESPHKQKQLSPGVIRDHWVLPPVDTTPELTRLQKWIASRPRNTIERWKIDKANLQAKFRGANWAPLRKLSPEAQEAIRVLNKNHPEWTTPKLAEKFEVSPEAIKRILKSKWRTGAAETEEKLAARWEKRGDRVWERWVGMGVVQTKKMKKQKRREWEIRHGIREPGADGEKDGGKHEPEAEEEEVDMGSISSSISSRIP